MPLKNGHGAQGEPKAVSGSDETKEKQGFENHRVAANAALGPTENRSNVCSDCRYLGMSGPHQTNTLANVELTP